MIKVSRVLLTVPALLAILSTSALLAAQSRPPESERYDRKFFAQLRTVFGRFRDSDLERVFEKAQPIQCSELVNDEGEWRTVAFFNEKRELGDWYRRSFDEVKSDLAVFIFKGVCRGEHGPVQITTKFPVTESVEAFQQNRIGFDQIAVNVNASVRVAFDAQSEAYRFDLPYMFLVGQQDGENIYSLDPPHLADRYKYATDVTGHWDCKSVSAENVTYQFLICRTTTLPRNPGERYQSRPAFGSSAYFILSDGKEASSSVKLTFDDTDDAKHVVEDASVTAPAGGGDAHIAAWEIPDSDEKLLDVARDEFRIRFARTWTGRIDAIQVLSAKRLMSLDSPSPAAGVDYCIWTPGARSVVQQLLAGDAGQEINYVVAAHDLDAQVPTSITFSMNSSTGARIGSLQCIFPRTPSAASVALNRWASIVGDNLVLEVRP